MKTKTLPTNLLRMLLVFGFMLSVHLGMAQGTIQKVPAPVYGAITDGKTSAPAPVSKTATTSVTLSDGTNANLNATELQVFNSKPTIAPAVNGKPDFAKQPIEAFTASYKEWVKANPITFKKVISHEEYKFVQQNNFGALYGYIEKQQNHRETPA